MIRELREKQGLTQRDLAKRAKVTGAYIAMLETGARKQPSIPTLKKIAKALGVPVTDLLQ